MEFTAETHHKLANVVHIRVPLKVAHNLDAMQKVTANVLAQLGCDKCHSGHNLVFDHTRQFIANERLEVHALGLR